MAVTGRPLPPVLRLVRPYFVRRFSARVMRNTSSFQDLTGFRVGFFYREIDRYASINPRRRLEDRRTLCAKVLTAQESELGAILHTLRSALREHVDRPEETRCREACLRQGER